MIKKFIKMKKIVFLIIGMIISFTVKGQQDPESDVVSVKMPSGAKSITKTQLLEFTRSKYKNHVTMVPPEKKNIYLLDGILISFWDIGVNPEFKKSLESTQQEILGMYKRFGDTVLYSKIVTINTARFLIYNYHVKDSYAIRFQSDFNKNNKNICGIIQFRKEDEAKAQQALQDFLNTVQFKE